MTNRETQPQALGTGLGVAAICMWSSTFAFAGSLKEQLGTLTTPALIYVIGGCLSCAWILAKPNRQQRIAAMLRLPKPYLWGCGGLFVLYMASVYGAVGCAADRSQVIDVGIVNYLWPGLTIALSVPLLGKKSKPMLIPGAALAFAGVYLTAARDGSYSIAAFAARIGENPLPYGLALVAAVCWALYSNLTRRWAGTNDTGAVPLFLVATGLVLLLARLAAHEETRWTARAVWELAYMAVFPTFLAYTFWDLAMRKGHMTLVASLSYLTPLLSTAVSCAYLGVPFGWRLVAACALVVSGACVCKFSVVDPDTPRVASEG